MQTLGAIKTTQEGARLVVDNILFATDFSPSSEVALRYALALARHYDSTIYVVRAVAADPMEALVGDARQKALDEARPVALRGVMELRRSRALDGVRHEVLIGEQEEGVLLNLPGNREFDLAVYGVGYDDGQAIVLEPAAAEAVRRSQCPALNVGSMFHQSADGELENILFATDFSPESLEASRYALSLAQEFQARLTLLHVIEGPEPKFLDERLQLARPVSLWMKNLVPEEARLWCELDFAVEFGRPAERILQAAWESHADLIVVGARGFRRLTSPGFNVRKVISNAWCPVLTISGVPDSHKQERFWRAAAAPSEGAEGGMQAS